MYHVVMECISFDTYAEAAEFQDALISAFCQMEKSEGIAAINRIDLVDGLTPTIPARDYAAVVFTSAQAINRIDLVEEETD